MLTSLSPNICVGLHIFQIAIRMGLIQLPGNRVFSRNRYIGQVNYQDHEKYAYMHIEP